MELLTIETKENLLLKPCLRVDEIMILVGCGRSKAYQLMKLCKTKYNGRVGIRTDAVSTRAVCLMLGTTLEKELELLAIAKGVKSCQRKDT